MAFSVNAVSPSYATNAAATSYARNINALNSYDDLLALETEILSGSQSSQSSNLTGVNDNTLATSDLLDLSPAALNILNGVDNNNGTGNFATASTGTNSTLTITGASGAATATQAALTATQQSQAAAIVSQFANQPLTQQTFTQIQNAFTAAGINPQEISIQQLLGAYSLAYEPSFAFTGQLFTETLASELDT